MQLTKNALPCFLLLLLAAIFTAQAQTAPDTAAHIEQLRSEIRRHDDLYYKKARPEISDSDYDSLKRRLRELETAHPELASADSPTRQVSADARDSFFPRHAHRVPMLSLDNTYEEADLRAFDTRVRRQLVAKRIPVENLSYTIEPKIDGAGISLVYQNGKLTHALTRGDGTEGDDIIANIRRISEVPQQLRDDGNGFPEYIEIRGEIYMNFADFERVNSRRTADRLTPFANPRNLAAGTMKLHNPAEFAGRNLRVFVYGIGALETGPMQKNITTQTDLLERCRAWGLPVIEHYRTAQTADEIMGAIAGLERARPALAYPIDGAVVKVNDFEMRKKLGAHTAAPRWAVAFKYAPKNAETRILAITVQVGRTGLLTPVAELEPVMLAGTKITRASLHNPQQLLRKGIRVGDIAVIEKAGEIIPEIVRVKPAAGTTENTSPLFVFPENCPACGTPLPRTDDTDKTAARCPDAQCPAQVKGRIAYFASKQCVGIAGLGEATVEKLFAAKLINDVADLYELTPEKIAALEGFGEKSARRLVEAINASRTAPAWRVLAGLGIPEIGPARARALANARDSFESLFDSEETQLSQIPGVGKNAAARIKDYHALPENRRLIKRLETHGLWQKTP